jgi:hypothetical protein
MTGICISQNELAQRWQISQTTLERWRAQRIGPSFLKLGGQVRYRLMDITAFEDQTLQVMSLQKTDVDSKPDAAPKAQLKPAMNPTGSGEASFGKFQKANGA